MNLCFAGGMCLQSSHSKQDARKIFSINDLRMRQAGYSAKKDPAMSAGLLSISLLFLLYGTGHNYYVTWGKVLSLVFSVG
jgi:hypothetical protein